MPYTNVPEEDWGRMDDCVEKVMAKGSDKEAAIAICHASVVGGKSIDLAIEEYHLADAIKIGARNSQADRGRIQAAHDTMVDLGAECKQAEETEYIPLDASKTLVTFGGEIKSMGDGRVGGYLVRYSDAKQPDLTGDYFDAQTDFDVDAWPTKSTVYFDHGLNAKVGGRKIGKAELKQDEFGVFAETVLDERDQYEKFLLDLAKAGKLGWSSGTASHLVEREQVGKSYHIKRWPLGLDASLTHRPAEPRNQVVPLKSLSVEMEAEVETQDGGETEAKQIETKGVETMELTEERLNEMVAAAAQQGAEMALKSLPVETKPAGVVTVTTDEADQPWERPGDFIKAVKSAYLRPMDEDPRLRSKKATGMSEGVPADGGYLVPEQMAGGILDRIYNVSQILSRISSDPVTGNNMSYNGVDETTHVGSMYGGILGYWIAEAGTITASRPKFYQMRLQLKEIAALAYATNDQLEDTPALDSWLTRTVPNVLRFQIEDAIIEGDGVGKPLGIMNSPSLVTAFRTDHTNFQLADVLTMYSRRWIGVNDYVWLVNQDVTPKLNAMTAATAPVYLPGGTVEGRPYGTLMGYPVIESEYCKTLYDTGDVVLASLSQYQAITKASGMKFASSLELAFVTNEKAFRWIMRIDGAPMWHSALTPLHGTNTVSPFVTCSSASS